MAKGPTFSRAKRFKFFYTDHHSIFQGAETVHVKGNFTASIDGNSTEAVTGIKKITAAGASIDNTLDMLWNTVARAKNVLRSEKVTVSHADLTSTASQYVNLYRASPGDSVVNVVGNLTAAFGTGPASRQRTYIQVGDVTDTDGFAVDKMASNTGWKWTEETNATKGAYFKNASAARVIKTLTSGMDIRALFTASDMYLASMNAGSIDFYIDVMSRA